MHSIVHFRVFEKKSREIVFLENIGSNTVTVIEWVFQTRIHHNISMNTTDVGGFIQASLDEIFTIREYLLGKLANGGLISNVSEYDKKVTVVEY